MITREQLMNYITDHGHAVDHAHTDQNTIRVLDRATLQGKLIETWINIPATFRDVRIWLGY